MAIMSVAGALGNGQAMRVRPRHDPSGAVITYTPDSAGQMLSAVDQGNAINYVTGASYGPGISDATMMAGQNFAGAGQGMIPYAFNTLNLGADPQQALYNRTAQQVQDQTRAAEAARGINTTPYGAGIEGQTMANFNIDWQNQLLQRNIAAAQSAGNTLGAGAGVTGFGLGQQQGVPGFTTQTSLLPYSTYNALNQGQWQQLQNLLGYLGGGQQLAQTPVADLLGLYGAGNQQQANLANIYKSQVDATKGTFGALGDIGKGLGSLAGAIPWGSIGSGLGSIGSWLGGLGSSAGSALGSGGGIMDAAMIAAA